MARPTRTMLLIGTAAVVVAAALGGGAAYLATAHSTPSAPPASALGAAPPEAAPPGAAKHGRHGGRGAKPQAAGGLLGRVEHGEFTTTGSAGASQTVDIQRGVITTVDPSSITLRSADGYTATYAITPTTKVAPARGPVAAPAAGSAPVAPGDPSALQPNQSVQVMAEKTPSGTTATRITPVKPPRGGPESAPGTPGTPG